MNIRTILIAAMLAVTGVTQAQVSEDAFKKAVDYVNCKAVEFSLKSKLDILKQYQKSCSCKDGAANTEISNFLAGVGGYDATIALANEIELLKKQFNNNWKVEDEVIFLTENIFADKTKYQKLYLFADKRKNDTGFATFKSDLKKELPAILAKQTLVSNQTQPNADSLNQIKPATLEERLTMLEQSKKLAEEEKGWFSRNLNIFVIISLILAIILFILKIIQIANNSSSGEEDVSEKVRKYVKDKISDASFNKGSSNQGVGSFAISNLEDKIRRLEIELREVKSQVDNSKIPFEVVQPRYEQQSWQDTRQPEVKTETFFLSTPNSDGSFNDSSVSPTYKEGASIYRFTKVGNNRAKFQIDEREASVKLALTYPDKSIDPVCDAVNAFNPKAKRITTVEAGEAELLNDKWIVNKTQKAKISYES